MEERLTYGVKCIGCSKHINIGNNRFFKIIRCGCGYCTPTQGILVKQNKESDLIWGY